MLKKALKLSLIISTLGVILLVGAMFLTKFVKKEIKDAKTQIPDQVEYLTPKIITEKKMSSKVKKKLKKKASIYTIEYQKAAKSVLDKMKKDNVYTLESPLLVVNPFGTNKTGVYLYFKHFLRVNTRYTVHVKSLDTEKESSIPDFSATMFTNPSNLPLAEQEGQLIGLLSGVKNYVSVYLYDESGKMVAKAGYRIELPKEEETVIQKLEAEHDREPLQLSEGLFAVFGSSQEEKDRYLPFYDNNGILRARLTMAKPTETRDVNLRFLDGKLFYGIDERRYALVNSIGRVEKIFDLGKGYSSYGDFDFTPANRYMLTFTKKKGKNNQVISMIDLYDGSTKELIFMKKLLLDDRKDLDLSAIRILNDRDILVSDRKTSSLFRINNVFRNPSLKVVLSDERAFLSKRYKDMYYKKEGMFSTHIGPSSLWTDRTEKAEDRTYHISLFDSRNGKKPTSYYVYILDENHHTYALESYLDFPYSSKNGSVGINGDHLIFSFGEEGVFEEYNADRNRLAKFLMKGNGFYKVLKFDMKGSWFSK